MKRQALLQGRQKKDSYDMGGDLVGGSLEGGLDSIGQRGVTGISRLPKTFASLDLRTGDFDYVRNLSFGFWFRFWVLSFVIEKLVQVFFCRDFCANCWQTDMHFGKRKKSNTKTKPIHFAIGRQLFDVADAFGLDFGDGQVGGDLQNAADCIVVH